MKDIFFIIYILLCIFCDLIHHLQSFNRIFSCGSFSGKHDCIGSVINSICHICHFGSCRTRIPDHGIQHLGCCDNRYIVGITFLDNDLLDMRHLLGRDFHSQVSSGHHNSVRSCNDLINIFYTLCIFDLGDNRNMLCIVLLKDLLDLLDTCCIPDKRSCDKINVLPDTEKDILFVLFCDSRKVHLYIRYINAFSLSQFSAVFHMTDDLFLLDLPDSQLDQTIIDQDPVSRLYVLGKPRISYGTSLFIPYHLFCIQCKLAVLFEDYFISSLQKTCTDLRSLCIQKDGYRAVQLLPYLFQQIHTVFLLLIVPVGKVKSCDIHSIFYKFSHVGLNVCIRSHSTNNFGLSHLFFLLLSTI